MIYLNSTKVSIPIAFQDNLQSWHKWLGITSVKVGEDYFNLNLGPIY